MKSTGMPKAILSLLKLLNCDKEHLIHLNTLRIPESITESVQMTTMEFAGVKFQTKVKSGTQYIKYVQNSVLKPLIQQFPNMKRLIVCEEKYTFTPDQFKAATHQQRQSKKKS